MKSVTQKDPKGEKRFAVVQAKAIENADGTFHCTMTTPTVDRVGDIVDPNGGDFRSFSVNPQLAYGHDAYGGKALPIGAVVFFSHHAKGYDADFKFADEPEIVELDKFPLTVKRYTQAGYLRCESIGFRALETERNTTGGYTIKKWEMLELSIVMIPANIDAMIAAKAEGRPMVGINVMAAPQIAAEVYEARQAWVKRYAAEAAGKVSDLGKLPLDAVQGGVQLSADPPAWAKALAADVSRIKAALGIEDNGDEPTADADDLLDPDEVDDSPDLTEALAALDVSRLGD